MTDVNDDTTTLNPGVGGDVMDVSDVSADNGTLLGILRERIILGGEKNRDALAEVVLEPPPVSAYGLPTRGITDPQFLSELQGIHMELTKIRELLELMVGSE
jgi:hypothetical protein